MYISTTQCLSLWLQLFSSVRWFAFLVTPSHALQLFSIWIDSLPMTRNFVFPADPHPPSDYTRILIKWNVTTSFSLYDRMNCAVSIGIDIRLHFRFSSHASHNGLALVVFRFCIHIVFLFWPHLSHFGYWQSRHTLYLCRCAFLSKLSFVAGGDLFELGAHSG